MPRNRLWRKGHLVKRNENKNKVQGIERKGSYRVHPSCIEPSERPCWLLLLCGYNIFVQGASFPLRPKWNKEAQLCSHVMFVVMVMVVVMFVSLDGENISHTHR